MGGSTFWSLHDFSRVLDPSFTITFEVRVNAYTASNLPALTAQCETLKALYL